MNLEKEVTVSHVSCSTCGLCITVMRGLVQSPPLSAEFGHLGVTHMPGSLGEGHAKVLTTSSTVPDHSCKPSPGERMVPLLPSLQRSEPPLDICISLHIPVVQNLYLKHLHSSTCSSSCPEKSGDMISCFFPWILKQPLCREILQDPSVESERVM